MKATTLQLVQAMVAAQFRAIRGLVGEDEYLVALDIISRFLERERRVIGTENLVADLNRQVARAVEGTRG